MDDGLKAYSSDDLANLAGLPRRTIRYYVALGVLDRPIEETRHSPCGEWGRNRNRRWAVTRRVALWSDSGRSALFAKC